MKMKIKKVKNSSLLSKFRKFSLRDNKYFSIYIAFSNLNLILKVIFFLNSISSLLIVKTSIKYFILLDSCVTILLYHYTFFHNQYLLLEILNCIKAEQINFYSAFFLNYYFNFTLSKNFSNSFNEYSPIISSILSSYSSTSSSSNSSSIYFS